ncbi:kinase C-like 1 [Octopus vulgaris]|uniref:Kinase C-like 1 n=1 Tax=Octopus vulgaris TaxID=6645 RepID=A0AA36F7E9_OCTVU|nr:kinase C-like 1 [Octopus vulgaris]
MTQQSKKVPQDAEETCIVHNFQPHRVVQPHQCLVCKKIIWNQGSSCVDCHIICHRKCETEIFRESHTVPTMLKFAHNRQQSSQQKTEKSSKKRLAEGQVNEMWDSPTESNICDQDTEVFLAQLIQLQTVTILQQ